MDTPLNSNRAPFQVLVFLYRIENSKPLYLILKRSDADYWQPVAGGGEGDENPQQTGVRETFEETDQRINDKLIVIPLTQFVSVFETFNKLLWGPQVTIIPHYLFGCEVLDSEVKLSEEHTEYA